MLGVILFDATQRVPIYWSSHVSREFVDGVLDVVLADRTQQFSYIVGSPSLYRGNVQEASNSSSGNMEQQQQQQNSAAAEQQQRISSAMLHASLLSGVVESHHKLHENSNSNSSSNNNNNNNEIGSGAMRPPHWPKLVRVGGTSLARASVAATCPIVSRTNPSLAPGQLTSRQISASRALNEGCVTVCSASSSTGGAGGGGGGGGRSNNNSSSSSSSSSPSSLSSSSSSSSSSYPWLHPDIAPVPTEYVSEWILSYEKKSSGAAAASGGLSSPTKQQQQTFQQTSSSTSNNNENSTTTKAERKESQKLAQQAKEHIPTAWYFPWRIFGENLGITYIIFSDPPPDGAYEKSVLVVNNNNDNNNSTATTTATSQNQKSQQSNNNNNNNQNTSSSSSSSTNSKDPRDFVQHEENIPGSRQSIANLFVLLCDAFKTSKSAEAPSCKALLGNLDLVHECCETVCPGNGRNMPLFDTALARKVAKLRFDS